MSTDLKSAGRPRPNLSIIHDQLLLRNDQSNVAQGIKLVGN